MKEYNDPRTGEHVGWTFTIGDGVALGGILASVQPATPNESSFIAKICVKFSEGTSYLSVAQKEWVDRILSRISRGTTSHVCNTLSLTHRYQGSTNSLWQRAIGLTVFLEDEFKFLYEDNGETLGYHILEVETSDGCPILACRSARDVQTFREEL